MKVSEQWQASQLLIILFEKFYGFKVAEIPRSKKPEELELYGGELSVIDYMTYNTNLFDHLFPDESNGQNS